MMALCLGYYFFRCEVEPHPILIIFIEDYIWFKVICRGIKLLMDRHVMMSFVY